MKNKRQKTELTYILLTLLTGWAGVHNFYSGHPGKAVPKIICSLFNIPCIIGLVSGIIRIAACGYDDPAYGLVFISFLGMIIPSFVIFILCIIDLAKIDKLNFPRKDEFKKDD